MKSFLISVNYACGGHSELDLHFEFDNKQAMTPKLLVSRHTSLYSNRTFQIQRDQKGLVNSVHLQCRKNYIAVQSNGL